MDPIPELCELSELERLEAESLAGPVLLYKHSSRCGTSFMAQHELEAYRRQAGDRAPRLVRLDVIEHRALARQIAERYGVRHHSPQLLLLRDARVVWHGSHGEVERGAIAAAVAAHGKEQPAKSTV